MIVAGLGDLPIFPCNLKKRPLIKGGWKSARKIEPPMHWPLVAVPTGIISGFDVIDIDPEGLDWLAANPIAGTRAHRTRRGGWHFFFRAHEGLRGSADNRISKGVHVRSNGNLIIWWAREGFEVRDAPLADWPEDLLRLARGAATSGDLGRVRASLQDVRVDGALGELEVTHYRGYTDWLRLMMACRVAGIDREDFIRWCVSDPVYADDAAEIERLWDGLKVDRITPRTLRVEVRLAQLRKGIHPTHRMNAPTSEVTVGSGSETDWKAIRSFNRGISSLLEIARRSEPDAFWVACEMRENVAEGRIGPGLRSNFF